MPAKYSIDPIRRMITSTGWGALGKQDLVEQTRRMLADPEFNPHYRQLWDLSGVTHLLLNFADMSALAEVDVFAPTAKRAFLAADNAVFGVARMFEMLREAKGETGIRVFRDRAEALQWIESAPRLPEAGD